jgi:hypothetical protein
VSEKLSSGLNDPGSESGKRSDFRDLKIALEVISHDSVKLLIPLLTGVIGLGTCAGLLIWSFGELQNFSPDSITMSRAEMPKVAAPAPVLPPSLSVAARPQTVRKAKPKARRVATRAPRRASSSGVYQDYYFTSQDDPTNGRVIRSNEACTEYSWNKTKVSSRNRNGFGLAY